MTIILHKSNLVIMSVPKCGSTWMARIVKDLHINHTIVPSGIFGHHHSLSQFTNNYTEYAAVIREPISWYISYWTYRVRTGWGNAPIDKMCQSTQLEHFMTKLFQYCPDYVSNLYEEMLGVNFSTVQNIGDLQSLPVFFENTLKKYGEIDSDQNLRTYPKINESKNIVEYKNKVIIRELVKHNIKVYDAFSQRFHWSHT